MKKILSCMLALFAAVSLYAADLNIYASGLHAKQYGNVVLVDYVLNAPADSIMLMLYGEDINQAFPKVIKETAYLTKGLHQLQLALPYEFPGTYHWAMKAFAPARATDETIVSDITVQGSRGLAYNNKVESPNFGMFYLADNLAGGAGGVILAITPDLLEADTIATGWGSGASSPMRIAIGEDDLLYVTDWSDNLPNINIVNPATPNAALVPVFGADHANADGVAFTSDDTPIHGSIAGCYVEGLGANRVLYTVDEDVKSDGKLVIYAYNIGELASPWMAAPSAVVCPNSDNLMQNANVNLMADGHGGFWFSQHRWADGAAIPSLMHSNAAGVIDFHSAGEITSAGYNNRGSIYVTGDKRFVVTSADGHAKIWEAFFTADALDSLKLVKTVALTGMDNIFNTVLDPAGNLYAVKGTGGALTAVALATEDNSHVTPAPAANTVTIEAIGEVNDLYLIGGPNAWNPTIGTQMTKTADKVFEGTFTFTEETSYFAFSSVLAENNDNGGWAYVNSHRFAGEGFDFPAVVGENYIAKTDLSFAIPAGTYKLTVNFNEMKMIVETVAPVEPVAPMYIAFKDVITAYGSDSGTRVETIESTIKEGAEYVSAFASNDPKNVYNARNGYGLKLGTGSKTGSFTLTLANAVKPDSIIVRAAAYNDTEGAATILGESVDLAPYGNKMITPIVKVYDGNTDVTELTISSTKRLYVTDITIYPHGAVAPVIADRTFGLGAALYLNVDTLEQSHVKYWLDANAIQKAYFVNANGDSTEVDGTILADSTKVKFMAPAGDFRYVGFARLNPENEAVWNNTALFDLRGTTGNYVKTWTRGSTGNGYNTVIWAEYEEPIPVVYKLKHPWAVGEADAWIWKECAEQQDGTWMLEDIFYGTGCNIDPTILDQNWIGNPTLVGNPASGDSCRFVINPAATDVAGILTITKLGDPTPVTEYEHLYWIGNDQGWKPSEGVEMTKLSDNVFERAVVLADTTWFGFLTVKPEKVNDQEDWTTANQNRFGAISNDLLVGAGEANLLKGENAFMIAGGSYTITVNLNDMKMTIAQESSAIEGIKSESNIQKVFKNGHVYIIRDGVTYDTAGARVE